MIGQLAVFVREPQPIGARFGEHLLPGRELGMQLRVERCEAGRQVTGRVEPRRRVVESHEISGAHGIPRVEQFARGEDRPRAGVAVIGPGAGLLDCEAPSAETGAPPSMMLKARLLSRCQDERWGRAICAVAGRPRACPRFAWDR